jgi:hypothetical protein
MQIEYEALKVTNGNMENKIKDLETQLAHSLDTVSVSALQREAEKVGDLERKNRKLQIEVDYLL